MLNGYGAWIDYFRGPGIERWTRDPWVVDPYDATSPGMVFAVDTATIETGTGRARRYLVVGDEGSSVTTLRTSRSGYDWARSTNIISGFEGPLCLAVSGGKWILTGLNGGAAQILTGIVDDGTGVGPVGNAGTAWTIATGTSGLAEVKALATSGARCFALTIDGGVYSDTGSAWSAYSVTGTSRSGNGVSACYSGTAWLFSTATGQIYASTDGVAFAYVATVSAMAASTWRLAVGAVGEVIGWHFSQSTSQDFHRSTDGGATWSAVTPASTRKPVYITALASYGGVWIATSSRAPHLWASNDLVSWRPLDVPVAGTDLALRALAWDGRRWLAQGNGWALSCDRASDPAEGAYVAHDAPATLADAGSLRGRLLSTATPSDGDVLAWDAATARWKPLAASGGVDATLQETPLASATGWTLDAGVVLASSTLSATITDSAAMLVQGAHAHGVRLVGAEVVCRIAYDGAPSSATHVWAEVGLNASDRDGVHLQLRGDGELKAVRLPGWAFWGTASASSSGTWVRLVVASLGEVSAYYSTATDRPASEGDWTYLGSVDLGASADAREGARTGGVRCKVASDAAVNASAAFTGLTLRGWST